MVKDQRYRSACIFGAVCPARDTGAALMITHVSVAAMNLLLEEVAAQLPPGTHAVMLIDNAGWHTANEIRVPLNISLLNLPPYSPELNAIERVSLSLGTHVRGRKRHHRCVPRGLELPTRGGRTHPIADRSRLGHRDQDIVRLV